MYLKFCGFTQEADVREAVQHDVQAIGFITYPKSARYVDLAQLQKLSSLVPQTIDRVAVTVNATMAQLESMIEQTAINTIQFHGNESIEMIQSVKNRYPDIQLFKAIPADEKLQTHIERYGSVVDRLLIDTPSTTFGGTGEVFDWRTLDTLSTSNYLVAGGINSDNVEQLIQDYPNIAGVDMASGIEKAKGQKDHDKMAYIAKVLKGE
ncbi:phosphoribosylanthranilate isomerase [Staphylococcus intermedius]|uniref:N-(5'-phosphoribosyl)anthranilate isomerase n=1 Tax=Staphylococcus intermedius NCTC 11048 TaxID=1141106 RepID=A0A380G6B9_STAIN|nr:phosphoribosylanthranilate isomerase [Staphylococcus intermedius]PCF86689.1 phosphoribosylanthranilate isomerase [Staphylococcus intermedius]PCF89766.1 phosphoribosylanthranilate isomerase [Staphylococcus intermedius]PNZ51011.1 phosphoribosylanthranilate isomerase [Staphylococcus intermedius NCTC 11048]SUM45818.1 N-(5'phosphoribosyl)anthranilate isomerase [Staphylococcus intermedius NCTC 11048]